MKEEGAQRRRFSLYAGIVSPPKHASRKLVRNASFGGYNEITLPCPEVDKDKGTLIPKDLSPLTISKSKSESKLYNALEKESSTPSHQKLTKKETLKVQKKNYRQEKKRATKEMLSTLKDPAVVILSDWLKIRGSLKSWTKLWCELKPGVLLLYKSSKHGQWVGTVLLNVCQIIERPSKKDGFCFKLFHPLDQSIWAIKGPEGETVGALTQPFPSSYLIIRATSESDGRCWVDALELALRCSSLLKRTMARDGDDAEKVVQADGTLLGLLRTGALRDGSRTHESEATQTHLTDAEGVSDRSDSDGDEGAHSEDSDSDTSERADDSIRGSGRLKETTYCQQTDEELGPVGELSQMEEVSEEHKGLIWGLIKQLRPGMDLSRVVLPTFVLEPRSFLDKLSDYYYHADLLSQAALEENAYGRMKQVVQWYLSGFYKKPQGPKKPYNPILGETFRCMWYHPSTDSKTYYIAEQVSHHPPVSAIYVSNRKDGFCISATVFARSKFYGNSLSAILDGTVRLTLLERGEEYVITMPYAHCKGILYGTMTLELGGKIGIECQKTGYSASIEFKLRPLLGGNDCVNQISGKIQLGKEVLCTLEGHWDREVFIQDHKTGASEEFWNPDAEVRARRLTRHLVHLQEQGDYESEKLWQHVTTAISQREQHEATQQKFLLEEAQREGARERAEQQEEWTPCFFELEPLAGEWQYKYADLRPWDPLNDIAQYEQGGVIRTHVRHDSSVVRCASALGLSPSAARSFLQRRRRSSKDEKRSGRRDQESRASTPDLDHRDSSDMDEPRCHTKMGRGDMQEIFTVLKSIRKTQDDICSKVKELVRQTSVPKAAKERRPSNREWLLLCVLVICQALLAYVLK
ncbi:oxysterol-binding protein-related protein 5 isoform X1 [Petromyzon marinus]|uniref:Oxysterol-binding protein n=1 Tax=Petromyzon marinus TaxID=7757 RepID=A0AAJ7TFX8_PETMA|nr:oxysterol-binding protein-related protein 5 isoform X1 [Petromyzon marinus]